MFVSRGIAVHSLQLVTKLLVVCLIGFVSLPPKAMAAGFTSLAPPGWVSAQQLTSSDGYARLEWVAATGTDSLLFRLSEEREGQEHASFIEGHAVTVFRVESGSYLFRVQACTKIEGQFPECGPKSSGLTLQVVQKAASEFSNEDPAKPVPGGGKEVSVVGGPDGLRPGLWYNPARGGHGWSFYWSNRLALPESHALHGNEYDLLGFWYTYEAKSRRVVDSPVRWVYEDYRPFAARLRLVQTGPQTYAGGVYVTRNGDEVHAGSASVSFGDSSDSAVVSWNVDFKFQRLSGIDPIENLVGSQRGAENNFSHYSGIWEKEGDAGYTVVENMGSFSEALEVLYSDSIGDPAWVQAANSEVPSSTAADLCFYRVSEGYAPDSTGTLKFENSGCDSSQPASRDNRNGTRIFDGFEKGRFWVDLDLPSGSIKLGSETSPANLQKVASFHRISFTEPVSGCVISDISPTCRVLVSWFTDGSYSSASAFDFNQSTGERRLLAGSTAPVMLEQEASLDQAGAHVFELRMGSSAGSTLIAQSAVLDVEDAGFPGPHSLDIAWLDQTEGLFRIKWSHGFPGDVDWFELEEQKPTGGFSVYRVESGKGLFRDFNYFSGPYGQYLYRVRACSVGVAGEQCSTWSDENAWTVSDPKFTGGELRHPWGEHAAGSGKLATGRSFHYAMGYHFRPEVDGFVHELGGLFDGSKKVKLYARGTGKLLAKADVNANNEWTYAAIPPVEVFAGDEYTVAVYLEGSGGSYYPTVDLPKTYAGISVLGSTYVSTAGDRGAIPVNLVRSRMYGQADIGFRASQEVQEQKPASPDVPPAPEANPGFAFDPESAGVGSTSGSLSIDARGSANYSIPILVAPGSGGLAPALSLDYSSQSPNDIAGVGWSLGGLSAITRCAATPEQGGLSGSEAISFTYADRFCLDGQQLKAISGGYGMNGTEYRTEIDAFLRVVSFGVAGQGPSYFKVWHGDGSVSEYGNSSDSRLEARLKDDTQTIVSWARNQFEDSSTNYMVFVYRKALSGPVEHFLDKVLYTGNFRAGTTPYAEVRFKYEEGRSDVPVSNMGGAVFARQHLLSGIDSLSKAYKKDKKLTYLRSYKLIYGRDGYGRKVIESIRECSDPSRSVCFPKATFSWIKSENEIAGSGVASPGSLPKHLKGLGIADVNGDGRPDLLPVQQNKGSFFFTISYAQESGAFSGEAGSYPIPGIADEDQPVSLLAIDLNADGFEDVIYPREVAGAVRWVGRLSHSTGYGGEITVASDCCFQLNPGTARIMDFNGDGLADLLTERVSKASAGKGELVILLNKRSPGGEIGFLPFRTLELDYPRDLLPDQPVGGGWVANGGERLFTDVSDRSAAGALPYDYNGDGRVDLIARVGRNYKKCSNNCNLSVSGFGREVNGVANFYAVFESDGADRFLLREVIARAAGSECSVPEVCGRWSALPAIEQLASVDINSDGLADLAFRDALDDWFYQLNTGAGFSEQQPIAQPPDGIRSQLGQLIDLNGDGFPEFIYPGRSGSTAANWVVHSNHLGSGFGAKERSAIRHGNTEQGDASILRDFDGDGMLDNLFIDFSKGAVNSVTTRLYQGRNLVTGKSSQANNVISLIETGTGARTELSYRPLTDTSVYTRMKDAPGADWGKGSGVFDLLAPVYVISSVTTSAPTREDSSARSSVQYHYVGAKIQSGGRGFLGFGEIITWNPLSGIRVNQRFRQDFPYSGLMADTSSFLTSSANKFRTMSNTGESIPTGWPEVELNMPVPAAIEDETLISFSANQWQAVETVRGKEVWRPSLIRTLVHAYTHRGQLEKRSLTNHRYGSFGRLSESSTETYAGKAAAFFSRVTTLNRHAEPDLSGWVLDRIAETTVVHKRKGLQAISRKSGFEYDPSTGLLVHEVTEPGSPGVTVMTDHQLDDFGNRIASTVAGAGMPARRSWQVYDALGRFSIKSVNHFGQATSTVDRWNAHGLALEGRNIDGVLTQVSADPMGHAFSTWTATGSWERSTKQWGRGRHCPEFTAWHRVSEGGGKPAQQTCYDQLGREVRVMTGGFDDRAIYVDSFYDERGNAAQVSEPYFAGDPAYWNVSIFDSLGRIKRVTSAAGGRLEHDYSEDAYGHCGVRDPRMVRTGNELGQTRLEVRNVLGETVSAYDHECGRVSYYYDAIGSLVKVIGADQAAVEMFYDFQGRKIAVDDPDKGLWQYKWNALGELVRQLDAKGQATDYEYDPMGRVTARWELSGLSGLQDTEFVVEQNETTSWQNSTAGVVKGKSQPAWVIYQEDGAGETLQRIDNSYDNFGRLVRSVSEQSGLLLAEETTFDNFGRIFQKFDASGDYRGIKYQYKTNGYLDKLIESRDGDSGIVYQEIRAMDVRGNISYMRLGNGVEGFAKHNPVSGQLEKLEAFDANGAELQEVDYIFDALGNLQSRHDQSNGRDLNETFSYDDLNRLLRVELLAPLDGISTPLETLAMTYSPAGNITWKKDVGSYTYGEGSGGPHAVTHAGGSSYKYDANGNQVSGSGRDIDYSVFDKAVEIQKDGHLTRFHYGVGNQRVSRIDRTAAGEVRITHYAGSTEFIETQESAFFRRHIAGVAVSDFYPETKVSSTRYQVKDHLGSIHNLTDESGEVGAAVWVSYSAFGERTANNWRSPLTPAVAGLLSELTTRGFTGHEHVDAVSVIHMNGRIYDPKLGRFLQADPFVQAPKNTQNLNRYSYALNNPLSLTDPSGYFFKRFLKRWGPLIAAIALSVLLPGPQGLLATHLGLTNIYGQAAITGFIAGAITSGTLKGAVIGSITALAVAGIVQAFSTAKAGSALAKPKDLMPDFVDYQHLYGPNGPPAGLYRVTILDDGAFHGFTPVSASDLASGDVIFTNGLKNGFREAIKNGTSHLHQAGLLKQSYVLNFNPTHGFFPDLLEASKDIVGAHTSWTQSALARNLASTIHQVSENGINGIQLVGHSQGGAITASALRYASKTGMNLSALSGGGVSLHGAPVNAWLARTRIARQSGAGIVSRAQFGDAVHVLGGLNISNPLELPIALLRFPALFSHDPGLSPHSLPCGGAKLAVCGR